LKSRKQLTTREVKKLQRYGHGTIILREILIPDPKSWQTSSYYRWILT